MKICIVVGARPNFVKIAPILAEIRQYSELKWSLIHTGQHYDHNMSESFFKDLEIPEPNVNLNVGASPPAIQTAEIMLRLSPIVAAGCPDLILVVGDVNSTLAGALVAAKAMIPVAHVEAGLRSFDRTMPEEVNRVLTDAVSDYCFTTESSANDNLARERVAPARIYYVGNVMIDTLLRVRERADGSTILRRLGVRAGDFVVLTLHRPSNVDDSRAMTRSLSAIGCVQRDIPVVFPVHPRTRERLKLLPDFVRRGAGLILTEPLPYLDFVHLMASAACVLTDSGGIQEETTALGVPCLTLRTTTERPITVTQGTNRIVGTEPEKIAAAWAEIRRGQWPMGQLPQFWDGRTAERIVKVLASHGSH